MSRTARRFRPQLLRTSVLAVCLAFFSLESVSSDLAPSELRRFEELESRGRREFFPQVANNVPVDTIQNKGRRRTADNHISVVQIGTQQQTNLTQQGKENFLNLHQYGFGNQATLGQTGQNNQANVWQNGSDNRALISQHGAFHTAHIEQTGQVGLATITQNGVGSNASIIQHPGR